MLNDRFSVETTEKKVMPKRRSTKRRRLIIAGITVSLFLIALAALLLNIDRIIEMKRDFILVRAGQALGREITADSLESTLLRGGRIKLKNLTISDDPRFLTDRFFRVDELVLDLSLLPLLWKEVRVEKIILRRPEVILIHDRSGEFNFSSIAASPESKESPSNAPSGSSIPLISAIKIEQGRVLYRDLATRSDFDVRDLDAEIKNISFNTRMDFYINASLGSEKPNFSVHGWIGPVGIIPDIAKAPFDIEGHFERLDLNSVERALTSLNVKSPLPEELKVQGPLSLRIHAGKEEDLLRLTCSTDATDCGIRYGERFQKDPGTVLVLNADLTGSAEKITVQSTSVNLRDLQLKSSAKLIREPETVLTLSLLADEANLGGWESIFPFLKPYEIDGMSKFDLKIDVWVEGDTPPKLSGSINIREGAVRLPSLSRQLTEVSGELTLTDDDIYLENASLRMGDTDLSLSLEAERAVAALRSWIKDERFQAYDLLPAALRSWLGESDRQDMLPPIPFALDLGLKTADVSEVFDTLEQINLPFSLPRDLSLGGTVALHATAGSHDGALEMSASIDLTGSNIRHSGQFYKAAGVPASLRVELQADEDKIIMPSAKVQLRDLQLEAKGALERSKPPLLHLSATSWECELSGWEEIFPALKQYALAGRVQAQVEIRAPLDRKKLPDIEASISCDGVTASLPIPEAGIDELTGRFAVAGDTVDLDLEHLRLGNSRLSLSAHTTQLVAQTLGAFLRGDRITIKDFLPVAARPWIGTSEEVAAGPVIPFQLQIKADALEFSTLKHFYDQMEAGERFLSDLDMDGPISFEVFLENANGELALSGAVDAGNTWIRYGRQFNKPARTPLSFQADLTLKPDTLTVSSAALDLSKTHIEGSGEIARGDTARSYFVLRSRAVDLPALAEVIPTLAPYEPAGQVEIDLKLGFPRKERYPVAIDGVASLDGASAYIPVLPEKISDFRGELVFADDGAELRRATFRTGDTLATLSLQADSFAPLVLNYSIQADNLDLDDYLGSVEGPAKPNVMQKVESEGRIVETGNTLSFAATLRSASGTVLGEPYAALRTETVLQGKILSIPTFSLDFCGGSILCSATYDFTAKPPASQFHYDIRDMDITTLFHVADPETKNPLRGRLNLLGDLTARGNDRKAIRQSLRATIQAEITQGRLPGINLVRTILAPVNKIPGLATIFKPVLRNKYTDLLTAPDTVFKKLESSAVVRNEKILIDRLQMVADNWSINGEAVVGFDENVDGKGVLVLSPQLLNSILNSVGKSQPVAEKDTAAGIHFLIKGTLSSIKIVPDVNSMAMAFPTLIGRKAGEIGEFSKNLLEHVVPILPFKRR